MDYDKELGDSLETILKTVYSHRGVTISQLCAVHRLQITDAASYLDALRQRGYVSCLHDGFRLENDNLPALNDVFSITKNGINYLELQQRFWKQFRVRSVYVPLGVAFLTSVIANLIALWLKR